MLFFFTDNVIVANVTSYQLLYKIDMHLEEEAEKYDQWKRRGDSLVLATIEGEVCANGRWGRRMDTTSRTGEEIWNLREKLPSKEMPTAHHRTTAN